MFYHFDINTCRNYCFRRKQHSYAACDAAPAARIYVFKFKYTMFTEDNQKSLQFLDLDPDLLKERYNQCPSQAPFGT